MRADRLISMMLLLQQKKHMTAKELSQELEVSIRTIYRDINALSLSGFPVYAIDGPGGGYFLDDKYRTSLTELTHQEIQAFFMLTIPGPLADLGISKDLKSSILKLSSTLPSNLSLQEDFIKNRLYMDPGRWFEKKEPSPFINKLQEAIWRDKKIDITYKRSSAGREITVSPYALGAKAGVWYLIAKSDKGIRVYRVSRIIDIRLSDNNFTRDPDFNLETFWKQWVEEYVSYLPKYKVKMEADLNKLKEFRNITRQDLLDAVKDGNNHNNKTLFYYTFETKEEARMYIMGLGEAVKVLEPQELKEDILEFISKISINYKTGV